MSSDTTSAPAEPTRCATHPNVETNLRCGKCERPICPKCLVFTPVGARCKTCANVKPLPTFQVGAEHYARAVAGALAVAIAGGIAWAFIAVIIPFLSFWLVLGQGYLSGEIVSRAAKRKRGGGLRVLAIGSMVLAYVVQGLTRALLRFPGILSDPGLLLQIGAAQLVAPTANIMLLLVFALAAYIAATRV